MHNPMGSKPVRWTPRARQLGRGFSPFAMLLLIGLLCMLVPAAAWISSPTSTATPPGLASYLLGGLIIWAYLFVIALIVLAIAVLNIWRSVQRERAAEVRAAWLRFTDEALAEARCRVAIANRRDRPAGRPSRDTSWRFVQQHQAVAPGNDSPEAARELGRQLTGQFAAMAHDTAAAAVDRDFPTDSSNVQQL